MIKSLKYALEALLLRFFFAIFRLLPLDMASAFGGKLGRWIGPHLKWHRIADYNLRRAYPELDEARHAEILRGMWDNLGRNFAETPWLGHATLALRIEISDAARALIQQQDASDQPCIFYGAHLGNWEMTPWVGALTEVSIMSVYRHLNNPLAEKLYYTIRSRYCAQLVPKGKSGARALLKVMRQKGLAGLLVDQKQNEGFQTLFMGNPAPTSATPAEMALRFDANLVGIRVIRTGGCRFEVKVDRLEYSPEISSESLTQEITHSVEHWVRDYPEQWLWLHQRWGKLSELPALS